MIGLSAFSENGNDSLKII